MATRQWQGWPGLNLAPMAFLGNPQVTAGHCDHDKCHQSRQHNSTFHYPTVTLQRRLSHKQVLFLNGSALLQERLRYFCINI